jgi:hypothetical protein
MSPHEIVNIKGDDDDGEDDEEGTDTATVVQFDTALLDCS